MFFQNKEFEDGSVCGTPTHSKTLSAPLTLVNSITFLTVSSPRSETISVAPNFDQIFKANLC